MHSFLNIKFVCYNIILNGINFLHSKDDASKPCIITIAMSRLIQSAATCYDSVIANNIYQQSIIITNCC